MKITRDLKYIQQKMINERIPISVSFELTHHCNYDCIHCLRDIRNTPQMTTEEVIRVLKELKEAGTLELALTGGEIFLRDDIWEILDEVKRLRFTTTIFSNLYLVDEKTAERLSHYHFKGIDVSIYGMDEKIHDKVTTIKGSWKKLMENLGYLKKYNVPVRLKMMLFNFNVKELPKVFEFAKKNNYAFTFDELLFVTDSGSRQPLMYTVYPEQMKYIEEYRLKLSSGDRIWVDQSVEKRSKSRVMCTAGRSTAAVTPDGDLLPCIVWRYKIGNLKNTHFKVLWEKSKKIKEILDIKDKNFVKCNKCKLKAYCRVCPGMNEAETGNPFIPSLQKCMLTKIKTEVLDGYKEDISKTHFDKV